MGLTRPWICFFVLFFLRPWIWITHFETAVRVVKSHLESGGTGRGGHKAEDGAQASGGGSWHHWGPPGSGGVRRPLKPQTSFKGANDKLYLTNVGSEWGVEATHKTQGRDHRRRENHDVQVTWRWKQTTPNSWARQLGNKPHCQEADGRSWHLAGSCGWVSTPLSLPERKITPALKYVSLRTIFV